MPQPRAYTLLPIFTVFRRDKHRGVARGKLREGQGRIEAVKSLVLFALSLKKKVFVLQKERNSVPFPGYPRRQTLVTNLIILLYIMQELQVAYE